MTDTTLPPTRLPPMRITDRSVVHDGFVTLEVVVVETTVRGEPVTMRREVHDHGDGAAVLAYDPVHRTAVLVRQGRAAVLARGGDPFVLEVIAGLVDEGEDSATAVRREALEEAGVTLGSLDYLGAPYSTPGAVTERIHLFLGAIDHSADRGAGGGLVAEHEEIEVLELPLATLAAMADGHEIIDLKTLYLIDALRRRRPDLFA